MMPINAIAQRRTQEWPKAQLCSLAGPLSLSSISLPEVRMDASVQGWLSQPSSCREEFQVAFVWAGLFKLCFTVTYWLALNIKWGRDNITKGHWNNKIESFHHFTFPLRGKKAWNTRPIKAFPVSDVSITDLAPKVKCFGLQMYIIWGSSYKSTRQVC